MNLYVRAILAVTADALRLGATLQARAADRLSRAARGPR